MTLTRRKQQSRDQAADPNVVPTATALESGMRFNCDTCSADITHNVRVKCAEVVKLPPRVAEVDGTPAPVVEKLTCPDYDLCIPVCSLPLKRGTELTIDTFSVFSRWTFPRTAQSPPRLPHHLLTFVPDFCCRLGSRRRAVTHRRSGNVWTGELGRHGRVRWRAHEGGVRSALSANLPAESSLSLARTLFDSFESIIPSFDSLLTLFISQATNIDFGLTQDEFQSRKKRRLESVQARPLILPPPKPMASAPTCHEIAGFMPGRLEYETEYENDAESLVKDMEFGKVYQFGGDEQPAAVEDPVVKKELPKGEAEEEKDGVVVEEDEGELQLKLAVLEMFNERYDRRVAAKEVIFDRGLMNYKTVSQFSRSARLGLILDS